MGVRFERSRRHMERSLCPSCESYQPSCVACCDFGGVEVGFSRGRFCVAMIACPKRWSPERPKEAQRGQEGPRAPAACLQQQAGPGARDHRSHELRQGDGARKLERPATGGGDAGALDIYSLYFATGTAGVSREQLEKLLGELEDSSDACVEGLPRQRVEPHAAEETHNQVRARPRGDWPLPRAERDERHRTESFLSSLSTRVVQPFTRGCVWPRPSCP